MWIRILYGITSFKIRPLTFTEYFKNGEKWDNKCINTLQFRQHKEGEGLEDQHHAGTETSLHELYFE